MPWSFFSPDTLLMSISCFLGHSIFSPELDRAAELRISVNVLDIW